MEPTEWTGLEAAPAGAVLFWSWRASDGWHLANLFALLASEAGVSVRSDEVRYRISRIVLGDVGRHFLGDYAAVATLQETRDGEGGYPAVTWLFRIKEPEAVGRAMLSGALNWASGVRSGGGAGLDFPYLEEERYGERTVYLLRGTFVHRDHGYDPCYCVAGELLLCSSSSAGLKRSLDALDGKAPRLDPGRLPGPTGGRSFVLYAERPESMKQVSNLYDYQVELYRRRQLTPAEQLTDTTDYRLRYEAFEELSTLLDRVVVTGRYDPRGSLRIWAEIEPSGAAGRGR